MILSQTHKWTSKSVNICAAALVGSWARGTARPTSDIDIMLLVTEPDIFRKDQVWVNEIDWEEVGLRVDSWEDQEYGVVWSRHIHFQDGTDVEFTFGSPLWASINSIEAGTLQVVSNGCSILYDPEGLLTKLLNTINPSNFNPA